MSTKLDENSAIVPNQNLWGFNKRHSTEQLISHLNEIWSDALDAGKVVGLTFIDFRKAFDTIDHDILGLKLQSNDISGDLAVWIQHYLSERKQHT